MTYGINEDQNNKMWMALSDPTRRSIFEIIALKSQSVQQIADVLPVTRPAVSQHLKLLDDAGLVQVEKVGRRRIYAANPESLRHIRSWLDQYWTEAMHGFAIAADEDEENRND